LSTDSRFSRDDGVLLRQGFEALAERLGAAGMISFLQLCSPGKGDYTKERHAVLDQMTFDDIMRELDEMGETKADDDDADAAPEGQAAP
jgi:hypothetical protein